MSDFYQQHLFTTLHRLDRLPLEEFEGSLERSASRRRMAKDITGAILRTLASQGTEITRAVIMSLESAYLRRAQDYVERYA